MMISRRKLSQSIATQLLEGKDRQKLLQQLASYVVVYRLEHQLDLIIADINRELARNGELLATVITARPLDAVTKKTILSYVREASDATHVTLEEHIDEKIIGGAIIETPLSRLDVSVASKLKQLRNS